MANHVPIAHARETLTGAMYAFKLLRDMQLQDAESDQWQLAIQSAREHAMGDLTQLIVHIFLEAQQRRSSGETVEEFLADQSLVTCTTTIGIAVLLLRQARELSPDGDLEWLAPAVTRELDTFKFVPRLVAAVVSRNNTDMLFLRQEKPRLKM